MTLVASWALWWLLAMTWLGVAAGNECGTWTGHHHRFGSACELQCHCWDRGEACDRETGECSKTGCAEGWMGPGCQYRNLAVGVAIDANYGSELPLAADGNRDTCSSQPVAATDPFIRLALPYTMNIAEVAVRFKNYSQVAGFSVYAGLSTARDQRTLCGGDQEARVTDHMASVTCGRHLAARFVTVLLPGQMKQLEICEIQVPQGRHLSYLAPMSGSSQDRNLDDLVNGRTDDHGSTREEDSPWITVDLQRDYTVSLIEVVNKQDVRRDLAGFEVYLSQQRDFSDGELVYVDMSSPDQVPDVIAVPLATPKTARYIRITIPGQKRRIQLREIWVLGGCVEKRCGFGCEELCYCETGVLSLARRTQGVCSATCDRNWRHVNGRCNTSICVDGKVGYECGYDCHCNGTCHPWLATCLVETETCSKHYYGTHCQAENVVAESVFTAAGNSSYSSAEETVDGLADTCGPILAGQAASWTVPLGEQRPVDQILIHVNPRTTGYGLEVITETDRGFFQCDTLRQESGARYLARCRNVPATHVRIRTRSTIQICEVAVLECAAGTFGPLCETMCLCADGRPCNKTTGMCPPGGCLAGYYSDKCDKECIAGSYGPNCVYTCGRCKGGAPCDTITGQCPGTCQAGWQGGRCDMECRNGTYGEDCVRNCGWCLDGAPCDKATGDCPAGCHAGYYTRNCSLECVAGRYGYSCNETCGTCKNGLVCDRRDGYCRGGCTLGKMPPLCQTPCDHMTWGEGCLQQCGNCRYNTTCDPITGICHHGCDPGVTVTSDQPMCTTACLDGYHGYNCSAVCQEDVCEGSSVCNKSTGGCLRACLYPGLQHPLCTEECWDGSFGQHCVHQCGMCRDRAPCNKTTGVCPAGCNSGFVGDKCDITEWSQQLTLGSTVALVFGVLFAVLGLAAVLVAVFFWRRTRQYAGSSSEDYQKKSPPPAAPVKPPPRNASLVSRVYDNTANYDNASNQKLGGGGVSEPLPPGTVTVDNLWQYVLKMRANPADLAQQFTELPAGLVHPCEAAKKAQNLRKNRYKEIFPYDHSRVKLDVLPGHDGNDYINACYVTGYNQPHMYIAAQGPTDDLVPDFWRLIWQQRCSKVIMLTRLVEHGKVKCCQYWPDEGSTQYGHVFVELKSTDLYADYNIRTFAVSTEDSAEIREVRQFHYEAWPDRHVPQAPASVVAFWSHTRATGAPTPGDSTAAPTLVHCSAGIGRTGTFLALDFLADQAAAEGYVNIQQAVQNLRHQRVNMLQNQDQYVFLHEALVEALLCPGLPVPCDKFALSYRRMLESGTSGREARLQREFEKLQHVTGFSTSGTPGYHDDAAYKAATSADNADKNRDQRILPGDQHRPRLTASGFGRSDYINAVFLPTYREEKRYVVTQNPLAHTVTDFWQLVYEHNINTIVTLDKPTDQAEVYWPGEGEVLTLMPFQLHHVTQVAHDSHIERTLTLLNTEQPREKSRLIKQFECVFWPGSGDVAPEGGAAPLLGVHEEVLRWQQLSPQLPILVHCLNGADKSGLYCVVTSAVERVKQDRQVALVQTLKQLRMRRPQIIPTYDQYKFCHDAVLEFLKSFDTFSDFYI